MSVKNNIKEIQDKAEYLAKLENDNAFLIQELNNLSEDRINILLKQYPLAEKKLRPVNFLRHLILKKLLKKEKIDIGVIDDLKQRINKRDIAYFKEYSNALTKAFENYPKKKINMFNSWKYFSIFYVFFYFSKDEDLLHSYLKEIADDLIKNLKLTDFIYSEFSFEGAQRFGATSSWIAIFPKNKKSHKNSYQFFIRFRASDIQYGVMTGSLIRDKSKRSITNTNNFEDVISGFEELKDEIIELNNKSINFWKFAPGRGAKHWKEFYKEGIICIGWDDKNLGDLNQYTSTEELAEMLGVDNPNMSNQVWNIESFRDANIGDIIIINKGRSESIGIGKIIGEYIYNQDRKYYKHTRKAKWITDKNIKFPKSIFRLDTFSPTLKWQQIKETYISEYPDLKDKLDELDFGKEIIDFQETEEEIDRNYWWLNANPKIWSILDFSIGDKQSYTVYNEKGNKRRIFEYFLKVKPGDIVIGYHTSPVRKIVALLEITKSVFQDENGDDAIEFEIKEFLENPIDLSELRDNPDLKDCEITINIQGSLFRLSKDEYEIIENLIIDYNPQKEESTEIYSRDQAIYDSGFNQDFFNNILRVLQDKKQIILQGPPGTGKTHFAKILAQYITENNIELSEIIQFHPSYSYEDFVEGYRPREDGSLKLQDGIFKKICHKAKLSDKTTVLIIDEINRGDISKIFGELIYLTEYRNAKIRLTYSPDLFFEIPDNLFIIGTMNTADRSLALMDYALRRRFVFFTLMPNYKLLELLLKDKCKINLNQLIENIKEMNKIISENSSLGKDFQIGHSYFLKHDIIDNEKLNDIWNYELNPLLLEYYYDNLEEVDYFRQVIFKDV